MEAMTDGDLQEKIDAVHRLIEPLREGEFSKSLYKVSVYIDSIAKSMKSCYSALEKLKGGDAKARDAEIKRFQSSLQSAIKFARLNLDAALVQALEILVWRPKNATKTDEQKKIQALQKTFDRLENPGQAMLEHYRTSSDPLNKYLVAGPWAHEYLQRRGADLDAFDQELCRILSCQDSMAGRMVLSYSTLARALQAVEAEGLKSSQALRG